MGLRLATSEMTGTTVVAVAGEVDVATAPQLRERLTEVIAAGSRRVVVDMSETEFLDSTGLGVLVGSLRRLHALGGTLAIVCSCERILTVFRITGLTRVFEIHAELAGALAAAAAPVDADRR